MSEQLPSPPGDADESRVASLRASWARIKPQPHLGPGGQTGWQLAKPDVMYLLDLAEEALARREQEVEIRAQLLWLVPIADDGNVDWAFQQEPAARQDRLRERARQWIAKIAAIKL